MSGMAQEIRDRMAADGIDTSGSVADALDGSSVVGTGDGQPGRQAPPPPAGESNADNGGGDGSTQTIPYSRFAEVNSRYNELRPYEELSRLGIGSDDAVRLASFERAYQADPRGTLAHMIDQQDLPESQKTALKALLSASDASGSDGALEDNQGGDGTPATLPPEVTEALSYVREMRERENNNDAQQRLDFIASHWRQLDEQDGITTPDRQRLMFIRDVAGSGQQFQTLEQLAEAARATYLQDRDEILGSAVQRRAPGRPLAVPSGGLPPTEPLPAPRSMAEARKLIEADIAAGRLPELSPGS